MGVPKFYRWISERYPCLSEVVKEFQIPEFDNLYLDMNEIFHACSHPKDYDPHFRITEEDIFPSIMHYLEFLFRMIKPRKVFFMAVDGVAPRAKMNHGRGGKFRSAKEAEEMDKRAEEKGETLPTEKKIDSNCITPGTPFMVKLQEELKYFIVKKISTDELWQSVRVYLSGHETPGEGEHKIMDFIRYERSQPGYDQNTKHCFYGKDADLMVLGLATHEPHFTLLRAEVGFREKKYKQKRLTTANETTFHLVHLSLLREYLDFEFSALKETLTFTYNLENVIDDWVLMGFLVGNDFIPHLPNLHVNHDALPLLWKTYINVLPSCGGYINEGGHLNLERFEKYLVALSKVDFDTFSEESKKAKAAADKAYRKSAARKFRKEVVDFDTFPEESKKAQAAADKAYLKSAARKCREEVFQIELGNRFAALTITCDDVEDSMFEAGAEDKGLPDTSPEDVSGESLSDEKSGDTLDDEFRHHKTYYYKTKMGYQEVTVEVLKDQAEGYVRGLQWILLYYYEGVPSWRWFYPHHYAPYMSDVKDFKNMRITFDLGTPFLPFEQQMAVLPRASKDLLPEAFQTLMTSDNSPVMDFYPVDFDTDLNGKQEKWEAVVLLPFIDENRLLQAMKTKESLLTDEERARNHHGPCLLFEYSPESFGIYRSPLPGVFPDIAVNHSRPTEIAKDKFILPSEQLVKGLLPEVKLDVFYAGFPTFKHIPHKVELRKEGVRGFQTYSRGSYMMLTIDEQDTPDIKRVARDYIGKVIFVGWPHMYEAKVVAVRDEKVFVVRRNTGYKDRPGHIIGDIEIRIIALPVTDRNQQQKMTKEDWHREQQSIKEKYKDRLGINIGDIKILIIALPVTGRKYVFGSDGRVTLEKQFGKRPVSFALQATVKDIAVHDSSFCQYKNLNEYLPEGSPVFMLGWPHYGCQGEVLKVDTEKWLVRINLSIFEEPKLSSIIDNHTLHAERYFPGFIAGQQLDISSYDFSRITGTIYVATGEKELAIEQQKPQTVNIGLNLKFTKIKEEVPGYTKLTDKGWTYTQKTIDLVREYLKKFPEIFHFISEYDWEMMLYESELIPKTCNYTLKDVQEYIKSLPSSEVKPMKPGAYISEGSVSALEKEVHRVVEINKKEHETVKGEVEPHLLFRYVSSGGAIIPDSSTEYRLFDRVVNIRQGYAVPFGLRGTVVGIHLAEVELNTVYEVIFDESFMAGISIRNSSDRGYRMPPSSLLNLTYGERENGVRTAQPTPDLKNQQSYGEEQIIQKIVQKVKGLHRVRAAGVYFNSESRKFDITVISKNQDEVRRYVNEMMSETFLSFDYDLHVRDINGEGEDVARSTTVQDFFQEKDYSKEIVKVTEVLSKYADTIMKNNPNVTLISFSPVKSRGYGTSNHFIKRKPCIVFFVEVKFGKNRIPLGSQKLPEILEDIETDVREGIVETLMEAPPDALNIQLGCPISCTYYYGTLGPIVRSRSDEIGFITSLHTLLQASDLSLVSQGDQIQNIMHKPVVHKARKNTLYKIGTMRKVYFSKGENLASGYEIALVELASNISVEEGGLQNNGLENFRGEITTLTDNNRENTIKKVGATTGLTKGKYAGQSWVRYTCHGTVNIELHNQILVRSTDSQMFANPGDSGALVTIKEEETDKAVGIVTGGSTDNQVIVTPIQPFYDQLLKDGWKLRPPGIQADERGGNGN